jgi:hypothetical protein
MLAAFGRGSDELERRKGLSSKSIVATLVIADSKNEKPITFCIMRASFQFYSVH